MGLFKHPPLLPIRADLSQESSICKFSFLLFFSFFLAFAPLPWVPKSIQWYSPGVEVVTRLPVKSKKSAVGLRETPESGVMFKCGQVHIEGPGPWRMCSLILPPACCVLHTCWRRCGSGDGKKWSMVKGRLPLDQVWLPGCQKQVVCLKKCRLSSKWLILFSQKILFRPWCWGH